MCVCVCARACPSLARDQDVPFCLALLSPSEIPPVWTANGVFSHLSACMGTDARTPSHIHTLSLIPEPEKHKGTQTGSFQGKKKNKPTFHIPFPPGHTFSSHTHKNLLQKAEALCDCCCCWWSWLLHKPLPAPTCHKGASPTAQQIHKEEKKKCFGPRSCPLRVGLPPLG